MPEHIPLMLAEKTAPTGSLLVTAPWDLSPIATVETVGLNGVESALNTAYALFRDRSSWLPVEERIRILERCAHTMSENAEFLALEAAREGGKPLIDSRVEVTRAIESIQLCADALRQDDNEVIPMGINTASRNRQAYTISEPVGVVVAISAFNHPLNLIAHQIGPAIAAGCPVIVKPAESTPLSCFRLVAMMRESGLPDAWCQPVVTDDLSVAESLVSDERVGFLSFIGSAKVGWKLRSMLSPGVRCALEHGGVAPVIVAEDTDMDSAVPKLLKGAFYHAGQVCVSVQRVYAHRSIARELAARLAERANALRIGDPTEEESEVGPLIRPSEVDRINEWVGEAIEGGAELLCGGHPISSVSYACSVLYNPPTDARISTQEVFGPIVCIYPYEGLDNAISLANALPWAFQAAVFSHDLTTIHRACSQLDASAVMVNDHSAFRVDWMPFAGLRQSGLGVGGIPYSFRDMQVKKLIVENRE